MHAGLREREGEYKQHIFLLQIQNVPGFQFLPVYTSVGLSLPLHEIRLGKIGKISGKVLITSSD